MTKKAIRNNYSPKSIFVIDDAPWHNVLLKKMLEQCGYEVHTFTDGRMLLERIKDEMPHMVISDINMPELDGFQLCRKIKGLSFCKELPVVYVSSLKTDDINRKIKKSGATLLMQKPVEKSAFLNTVAQHI